MHFILFIGVFCLLGSAFASDFDDPDFEIIIDASKPLDVDEDIYPSIESYFQHNSDESYVYMLLKGNYNYQYDFSTYTGDGISHFFAKADTEATLTISNLIKGSSELVIYFLDLTVYIEGSNTADIVRFNSSLVSINNGLFDADDLSVYDSTVSSGRSSYLVTSKLLCNNVAGSMYINVRDLDINVGSNTLTTFEIWSTYINDSWVEEENVKLIFELSQYVNINISIGYYQINDDLTDLSDNEHEYIFICKSDPSNMHNIISIDSAAPIVFKDQNNDLLHVYGEEFRIKNVYSLMVHSLTFDRIQMSFRNSFGAELHIGDIETEELILLQWGVCRMGKLTLHTSANFEGGDFFIQEIDFQNAANIITVVDNIEVNKFTFNQNIFFTGIHWNIGVSQSASFSDIVIEGLMDEDTPMIMPRFVISVASVEFYLHIPTVKISHSSFSNLIATTFIEIVSPVEIELNDVSFTNISKFSIHGKIINGSFINTKRDLIPIEYADKTSIRIIDSHIANCFFYNFTNHVHNIHLDNAIFSNVLIDGVMFVILFGENNKMVFKNSNISSRSIGEKGFFAAMQVSSEIIIENSSIDVEDHTMMFYIYQQHADADLEVSLNVKNSHLSGSCAVDMIYCQNATLTAVLDNVVFETRGKSELSGVFDGSYLKFTMINTVTVLNTHSIGYSGFINAFDDCLLLMEDNSVLKGINVHGGFGGFIYGTNLTVFYGRNTEISVVNSSGAYGTLFGAYDANFVAMNGGNLLLEIDNSLTKAYGSILFASLWFRVDHTRSTYDSITFSIINHTFEDIESRHVPIGTLCGDIVCSHFAYKSNDMPNGLKLDAAVPLPNGFHITGCYLDGKAPGNYTDYMPESFKDDSLESRTKNKYLVGFFKDRMNCFTEETDVIHSIVPFQQVEISEDDDFTVFDIIYFVQNADVGFAETISRAPMILTYRNITTASECVKPEYYKKNDNIVVDFREDIRNTIKSGSHIAAILRFSVRVPLITRISRLEENPVTIHWRNTEFTQNLALPGCDAGYEFDGEFCNVCPLGKVQIVNNVNVACISLENHPDRLTTEEYYVNSGWFAHEVAVLNETVYPDNNCNNDRICISDNVKECVKTKGFGRLIDESRANVVAYCQPFESVNEVRCQRLSYCVGGDVHSGYSGMHWSLSKHFGEPVTKLPMENTGCSASRCGYQCEDCEHFMWEQTDNTYLLNKGYELARDPLSGSCVMCFGKFILYILLIVGIALMLLIVLAAYRSEAIAVPIYKYFFPNQIKYLTSEFESVQRSRVFFKIVLLFAPLVFSSIGISLNMGSATAPSVFRKRLTSFFSLISSQTAIFACLQRIKPEHVNDLKLYQAYSLESLNGIDWSIFMTVIYLVIIYSPLAYHYIDKFFRHRRYIGNNIHTLRLRDEVKYRSHRSIFEALFLLWSPTILQYGITIMIFTTGADNKTRSLIDLRNTISSLQSFGNILIGLIILSIIVIQTYFLIDKSSTGSFASSGLCKRFNYWDILLLQIRSLLLSGLALLARYGIPILFIFLAMYSIMVLMLRPYVSTANNILCAKISTTLSVVLSVTMIIENNEIGLIIVIVAMCGIIAMVFVFTVDPEIIEQNEKEQEVDLNDPKSKKMLELIFQSNI
ncbi:hypothetical protein PCE1_000307 [Barthelona sp. PCE]